MTQLRTSWRPKSIEFRPIDLPSDIKKMDLHDRHGLFGHPKAINYMNEKPLLASVFMGVAKEESGKLILATLKVRYIEHFMDQEFANFIKNYAPNHNALNMQFENEKSLNIRCWECENEDKFIEKIKDITSKKQIKIVGVNIREISKEKQIFIAEKLWLDHDIVGFMEDEGTNEVPKEDAAKRAQWYAIGLARRYLKEDFFYDVFMIDYDEKTRIVVPKLLTTLDAYRQEVPKEQFDSLLEQARIYKQHGKKMLFISSTMQGGGVALMRHAMIRVCKLLDIDFKWMVLFPDHHVFEITKKKFHNILQGILPESIILGEEEKMVYNRWIESNWNRLRFTITEADVVVIDDYQPSGLIPYIKKDSPHIKIVYRSHIHIRTDLVDRSGSSQAITWNFIWNTNRVKDTDLFVSHPIKEFVPAVVPEKKVQYMPASTDPLDGLNKPLTAKQSDYYMNILNLSLIMDNQTPLDPNRPYICQIARFDPSKGLADVLMSFRQVRKIFRHMRSHHVPQLVICGHGAVDDPEGIPVLEVIKSFLDMGMFKDLADDIKVLRLPHNDQILAAVAQNAYCIVQLSHREGLEVKITEALHRGKPVVLFNSGGMSLQVLDNENSFVVQVGDTKKVGDLVFRLFADSDLYDEMTKNAREKVKTCFMTVANVTNWLKISNKFFEK